MLPVHRPATRDTSNPMVRGQQGRCYYQQTYLIISGAETSVLRRQKTTLTATETLESSPTSTNSHTLCPPELHSTYTMCSSSMLFYVADYKSHLTCPVELLSARPMSGSFMLFCFS
jgi:hypothetical protein